MWGCLSMWHIVASLFRSSNERPGDDVNFATSTTFNKVIKQVNKLVDLQEQVLVRVRPSSKAI